MSKIIPFNFDGASITVIADDNGEPWFVAKEVATILGYSDAEAMTRRLDEDEKQNRQIVGFGPRGVSTINESGLYSSILGSQKTEAKPFKKWVTSEVLPSIRKTGSYSAKAASQRPMSALQTMKMISFAGDALLAVPGARADVIAVTKLRMFQEHTGLNVEEFRRALPPVALDRMVHLNPSQIGVRVATATGRDKVSSQLVNKVLLNLGMQRKVEDGWVLTEAGTEFGEVLHYKAENLHQGLQIDWFETAVQLVVDHLPEDATRRSSSVVSLAAAAPEPQGALL